MDRNKLKFRLVSDKFREIFIPTLLMIMANNMALFVDSVLVSAFVGAEKMPAVQLCYPVVALVNMVYWMFGLGGSLLVTNAQAEHNSKTANRIFSVTLVSLVIFGLAVAGIGLLFQSGIARLLCVDASLRPSVTEYFTVLVTGMPLLCLIMCLSYFARTDGCPKLPFRAILISNACNLIMDCVLMKFAGMGLRGAALATIAGYVLGLIYIIISYSRSRSRTLRLQNPFSQGPKTFGGDVVKICIKGIPTASAQGYMAIASQVLNNIVLFFAAAEGMQAYSIYKNSLFLCYILFIGTAQTLSPIVSVYTLEKEYDKARFVLKKSLKAAIIGSVILGGIFFCFPQLLPMLYKVSNPEVISVFTRGIRIAVFAFVGMAFNFIMIYYLQSINRQKLSAIATALESIVLPVTITIALANGFGMTGVWMATVLTEVLLALAIILYMVLMRKKGTVFLLPDGADENRYEFTAEMNENSIAESSLKYSRMIGEKTDTETEEKVLLALKAMLGGILKANRDINGVIDVTITKEQEDILLSFRDMGHTFNPKVSDEGSEEASVLYSISEDIKYDRSLGMNATLIRLKYSKDQ